MNVKNFMQVCSYVTYVRAGQERTNKTSIFFNSNIFNKAIVTIVWTHSLCTGAESGFHVPDQSQRS